METRLILVKGKQYIYTTKTGNMIPLTYVGFANNKHVFTSSSSKMWFFSQKGIEYKIMPERFKCKKHKPKGKDYSAGNIHENLGKYQTVFAAPRKSTNYDNTILPNYIASAAAGTHQCNTGVISK